MRPGNIAVYFKAGSVIALESATWQPLAEEVFPGIGVLMPVYFKMADGVFASGYTHNAYFIISCYSGWYAYAYAYPQFVFIGNFRVVVIDAYAIGTWYGQLLLP